jgi:hypothetical protein
MQQLLFAVEVLVAEWHCKRGRQENRWLIHVDPQIIQQWDPLQDLLLPKVSRSWGKEVNPDR